MNNVTHSEKLTKNSPHTQNAPYVWLLLWSKNSKLTTYHSYKYITILQRTFPEAYFSVNILQSEAGTRRGKNDEKNSIFEKFHRKKPVQEFLF